MKAMRFSIEIHASKERVWDTLWQDETFREWANNIDEGMYLEGDLKQGNTVHFRSPTGFGVKSLVEKLVVNEFVSFRHMTDTQDDAEREKEWTGGTESYSLAENGDITTLTVTLDVPPEQVETFTVRVPKALESVKELAERKK